MTKLDWQRLKDRDNARLARLDAPPNPQNSRKLALRGMPRSAQLQAPSCPTCHESMQLRTRSSDSHRFWGCSNYPDCRHTEDIIKRKGR